MIMCVPYNSDQTNGWKIMEERENEGESYQPYVIKGVNYPRVDKRPCFSK